MESIEENRLSDEQPLPARTIPMLVDQATEQLNLLLRLVRPAQADPIKRAVDAFGRLTSALLAEVLRQAYLQSIQAVDPALNLRSELEPRIRELERLAGTPEQPDGPEQAREVGGG